MKFPTSLIRGKLIQRYKRFLADIELESGEEVTAHCANPGSMLGLKDPGMTVWVSEALNKTRKLKYDLQLVDADGVLVAINTGNPNKLVEEAILDGTISELSGYDTLRREVKYGVNSRIDILLSGGGLADCYVEVKNVHMLREKGLYEFPDSVTSRGAKHLVELSDMVEAGHRAVMVYLVQREDGSKFRFAEDYDPAYVEAYRQAKTRGVEALVYNCHISTDEITVKGRVTFEEPE